MSLDQSVLLWSVLLPAVIAALFILAARLAVGRRVTEASSGSTAPLSPSGSLQLRTIAASLLVAGGWVLAVAITLVGIRDDGAWYEPFLRPDEFWKGSVWSLLTVGLLLAGPMVSADRRQPWRWILAAAAAILIAYVAIPGGETWSDTYSLHRLWMAAGSLSLLVNWWAVESLSSRRAQRWSLLVVLAALGPPMVLCATTYASLGQWSLAAIVATLLFAIIATVGQLSIAWIASIPALAFATLITTAARFYTYEQHPAWVYGIALFLPAIITLFDRPLPAHRTITRVATAALVSLLLIGALVYQLVLAQPAESW